MDGAKERDEGDEGMGQLASIPEELRQLLLDEHLFLLSLGRLMQTSRALRGLCASSAAWQRGYDALGPLNCLHQVIQEGSFIAMVDAVDLEQVADWLKVNDPRLQAGFERATPFERFRGLLAFLQAAGRNVRRLGRPADAEEERTLDCVAVLESAHPARFELLHNYNSENDRSWERESYEDHARRSQFALMGSGAACRFKHLALGSDGHLRALVNGCRGLQGLDESLFSRVLVESVCPMPTNQQLAASLLAAPGPPSATVV
ncbi:hypothetical protein T492DRAFT_908856 [Pavlovales sp. CCMP2436]|nr:hypothetical protein T492DRAFT_908856 [Pavlovales sp. CCMP2436]